MSFKKNHYHTLRHFHQDLHHLHPLHFHHHLHRNSLNLAFHHPNFKNCFLKYHYFQNILYCSKKKY